MEKEKNELQSRREFFKRAAKGALPIIGAIVLANAPVIAQAAEDPMGCNKTCYHGCHATCSGHCQTTCNASCRSSHARRTSMVESIER